MAFLCHHRIEFMPSPQCFLQLQNNIYAMQNTCHSKESIVQFKSAFFI